MKVLFISIPYWVEQARAVLKGHADVEGMELSEWRKLSLWSKVLRCRTVEVVHVFFGRVKLWEVIALRLAGKKVIIHFIGSDTLNLRSSPWMKRIQARLASRLARFTAVSDNLVRELVEDGMRADCLPFVSSNVNLDSTLIQWRAGPPWKLVTYVRDRNPEMYGFDKILRAAQDNPDVTIQVLFLAKNDMKEQLPANVELLGWRDDVGAVLRGAQGLIRVTQHDGLPNTVMEALSYGLYVVFSREFPGCLFAETAEELSAAIQVIRSAKEPNWEGFDFIGKHLSPATAAKTIVDYYRAC